nr:unnamed protein product [Digitaria exilis]
MSAGEFNVAAAPPRHCSHRHHHSSRPPALPPAICPPPPFPPLAMAAACVEPPAGFARHHAATQAQPTRKRMRVAMGTTDDYEQEEEAASCLGEGGFGAVVRARHRATGQPVAIKRLRTGGDQTALLRESLFLKAASAGNPFVVGSRGLARDPATLGLCLVMDCGGTSLHDALRPQRNGGPPLAEATVCGAMWQLLTGAKKMHDAHIMHRDIKPENILVGDDHLRFCDFGLAVYMAERPPYTVAGTLWYMAPEMLLGKQDYDALVDTWSLGCVMAELVGGVALFQGCDDEDQLCAIFEVLGVPDGDKAWPWFSTTPFATKMDEADKKWLNHDYLRQLFPETKLSKDGFEVLSGLLTVNPDKRLTAAAALKHSWFSCIDVLCGLLTVNPDKRLTAAAALKHPWFAKIDVLEHAGA